MKIVVLLKEVPDTYGNRTLHPETGLADRATTENALDEICERALEAALSAAEQLGDAEVVALSMGPQEAQGSLRRGLAMGASAATLIADERLVGADVGLTSEVLAAELRAEQFDLVIAGNQSTDGAAGVLPAMLAELLDVPVLSHLCQLQIEADRVAGVRVVDSVKMQVSAELPAVISVTEALPEGRLPNFKGIMAAKKKTISVKTLDDLGIDADDMTAARSIMISIAERPARAAGEKISDESGDAAERLAKFLAEQRLI